MKIIQIFFFNLSYFLQKIPDSFFNTEIADTIVKISQILFSFNERTDFVIFSLKEEEEDYSDLIKKYNSSILFNQKIILKFNYSDQKKNFEEIKTVLNTIHSNKKESLTLEMMKIINILLYYDRDKYKKFCCKEHSEYFNTKCEIMNPELCEVIKPLEDILKLYFKQYNTEASSMIKDNKDKNMEIAKTGYDLINLFEVLTIDSSPCLQKMIIKLFVEFFNSNLSQAYKYVNLIEKDKKMFDICLFVFKSSIFDVKLEILNLIFLLNKMKNNLTKMPATKIKDKDKDKEILQTVDLSGLKEIFILNNILPYYLLSKEELKNVQIDKIKKQFYVSGAEYNYLNKTDIEQKLFSIINRDKLNETILNLFSCIYKAFKENSSNPLYLNLLISILSKADLVLNINFLVNLQKTKNIIKDISSNQKLLYWLLETSFQAFMMKSTNYDKNKFMSRLYFSNVIEEKDIKTKIDQLNELCNDLLLEIFKNNIYKLDYLMTWSKYYYQLTLDNNKITNDLLQKFLFNILIEIDNKKIKKEITPDILDKDSQKQELYFMNILFEFITYFKYTPAKNDKEMAIKIKEDNVIFDELSSTFRNILKNDTKNDIVSESLKNKMKNYTFLKKLFLYFAPLWNKILRDENDIFGRYIENKKNLNSYISEIEILFYQFDDINELNVDSSQKNIANKGIQCIYILYHFFIILFNCGGDKEEIKEIITVFRHFLIFLIVSSCTLSTTIDKKKRKWPKTEDYQMVQSTVKNILYNSFYFFHTNIKIYDEIIETKKNISETDKDYYLYIKHLLYENYGHFLKTLNGIFRVTKKEEEKKSSKKGIKNILSKVKGFFTDSEGVKSSGPYTLMEKLYENLNLDVDSSYLNKIPNIEFKTKVVKNTAINPKLEESIKSLIKDPKIKSFFNSISYPSKEGDDLNKNKLYPFVDCIKRRTSLLNWFIPCYDNLPNIDCDINDPKYYILPKLLLVCDYFRSNPYEEALNKNIINFNADINKKILLNFKKYTIEDKARIFQYAQVKKRLFSFLGIWSTKEFFYNTDKYELKYKLVNHLTEDYTRVLLKPILNIDYYLPEFSKFNYDGLFRKNEKKIDIYRSTDLSFIIKEHKQPLIKDKKEDEEEKEGNEQKKENIEEIKKTEEKIIDENKQEEYNILYDLKLKDYKDLENITMDKEKMNSNMTNELFREYIEQKLVSNPSQNIQADSCLIKQSFHLTGVLFTNKAGIGFYSYNKIHKENDEDLMLKGIHVSVLCLVFKIPNMIIIL